MRELLFDTTQDTNSWIEGIACDDSGDVVSATAYMYGTDINDFQVTKVFDFINSNVTEIYKTVSNIQVSLNTAVSKDGAVVAVVASRENMDDNAYWAYDDVGEMTVLSKNYPGFWKILGEGSDRENSDVLGG